MITMMMMMIKKILNNQRVSSHILMISRSRFSMLMRFKGFLLALRTLIDSFTRGSMVMFSMFDCANFLDLPFRISFSIWFSVRVLSFEGNSEGRAEIWLKGVIFPSLTSKTFVFTSAKNLFDLTLALGYLALGDSPNSLCPIISLQC